MQYEKIASIRDKKPHVYRFLILKQMADHIGGLKTLNKVKRFSRVVLLKIKTITNFTKDHEFFRSVLLVILSMQKMII